MKKLTAVLSVALLVSAVLASFAFAGSGAYLGAPQRLGLTRSGGTSAATSFQDTMTCVSTADSIRTSNISTAGWNWGLLTSVAATNSPVPVAKVEVWIDPGTTGLVGGDSLGFCIEPSFDGGSTYIMNGQAKALAYGASALGNVIVMASQNGALYTGTGGAYGYGYICVDPDGGPIAGTTANYFPFMLRNFRLKIFGDAGAIGPIHVSVTPLAVVQ